MSNQNISSRETLGSEPDDFSIDELELQRLLDGRLDSSEFQALAHVADQIPGQWKQIALAALEEQQWRRCMHETNKDQDGTRLQAPEMLSSTCPSDQSIHESRQWLALAGAVLLAFTAGWMGKQFTGTASSSVQVAEASGQTASALPEDELRQLDRGSESIAISDVADNDDQLLTRGHETWQQLLAANREPIVNQRTREVLADIGYQVFEKPVVFVVENERGEGYVVPRREIVLVSTPGNSL